MRPKRADETAGDYVLEEQVGYLLRRAHQRATAIFQCEIGNGQLTPTQWAALVKLDDEGPLSQNHLGRLTAMDPATIQGVIRRLAKRGLIERRADAVDRRRSALTLSPAGEALVERLRADGHRVSEAILASLGGKERKDLLDLLKRLG
ncbi:MAG: MarR family winged helix-turn-helix transcriptional regulator [Alphaproteobacteria bacterium]